MLAVPPAVMLVEPAVAHAVERALLPDAHDDAQGEPGRGEGDEHEGEGHADPGVSSCTRRSTSSNENRTVDAVTR